jgi:hypothetical protein
MIGSTGTTQKPGLEALVEMLERRLNAERAERKKAQALLALRDDETGHARHELKALTDRLELLIA